MLQTLKMLLGIDLADTSKDGILNHFINQALRLALSYCNVTELSTEYNDTIAELARYLYINKDSMGYSQKTEGERSVSFEIGIPEYIKVALPIPRIKVGAYNV